MFICTFCRKSVPAGTHCKKVVTKTVMFQHPHRPRVHKRWGVDKQGKPRIEWIDDKGGVGPQIVQEVAACPECGAEQERKKAAAQQNLRLI